MPEATIDKDHFSATSEHDVRRAWEISRVKSVAIARRLDYLRTSSSGFVSLDRMRDIFLSRCSGVRTSITYRFYAAVLFVV